MTAILAAVPDEDLLTGPQAARAAGISYRQLDFAVRAGLLNEVRHWRGHRCGSGSPRLLTISEVRVARDAGRLVRAGLDLRAAHWIARSGESRTELAPGIWLELGPPLSESCGRGDCGGCFPEEPGGCGHGCHDDEVGAA